jgi:endonuclease/exonuclease/phosphatase family metal-dependent hydrolase
MTDFVCVTANLNKAHNAHTVPWLEHVLGVDRPALVFGQEMAAKRVQRLAGPHGYQVIAAQQKDGRWMGSWILVRSELDVTSDDADAWSRFECYVAAGWVALPVGPVRVVSVHAIPDLASLEHLSLWQPAELPLKRTGPTRRPNALRYSDLVLHSLSRFAGEPLIAAGDFNESRHYNAPLGGQFFDNVKKAGLTDVTYTHWGEETQTRFHPTDPALQVDHVFASQDVGRLIVSPPRVDPAWSSPDSRVNRSDHAPVWFTLSVGAQSSKSS